MKTLAPKPLKPFVIIAVVSMLLFSSTSVLAQTIKRWGSGQVEIKNNRLDYAQFQNVFKDYKWTYPDIKSKPMHFINGVCTFKVKGQRYTAALKDLQMTVKCENGDTFCGVKQVSDQDMYFDKSKLTYTTITTSTWTPRTVFRSEMYPVQMSRMVPYTTYSNGQARTSYRTEFYTTYQSRMVAHTEWQWQPSTRLVPHIPQYPYYSFNLDNEDQFVVYESDGNYYFQNSSYLQATDENDVKYIFIDTDNNGYYLDKFDQMMFNTWNPNDQTSAFRSAGTFIENHWYTMAQLQEDFFVTFRSTENGVILMESENNRYANEVRWGKVKFAGLSRELRLYVNGKHYGFGGKTRRLKSEYGKFKVRIEREGYQDFERVYEINDRNPEVVITYEQTPEAAYVRIDHVFEGGYMVAVAADGYQKNHYCTSNGNAQDIKVPTGRGTVTIHAGGATFTSKYNLRPSEIHFVDFGEKAELEDSKPKEEE